MNPIVRVLILLPISPILFLVAIIAIPFYLIDCAIKGEWYD